MTNTCPCASMLRWFRERNVSPYEECPCIFYGDPSSENTLPSLEPLAVIKQG